MEVKFSSLLLLQVQFKLFKPFFSYFEEERATVEMMQNFSNFLHPQEKTISILVGKWILRSFGYLEKDQWENRGIF